VIAGNPTRDSGPLYRAATRDRALWDDVIHITGDPDDPERSPRIDIEWARMEIKRWGGRENPWVMTNILGQFPSTSPDKLIGVNAVMTAQERDTSFSSIAGDPILWGLDPAYYGDDPSCLARRRGIVAFPFRQWRNHDGPQLATAVATMILEAEAKQRAPDAIFIDVGGVGASCFDHLKLLGWGYLIVPVEFGGSPTDDRFADKRTEIWWRMAQWVTKTPSCLPEDLTLADELTAPLFEYRILHKRTVLKLEAKKDLRARGVPSPNKGDGLALTFAEPVAAAKYRQGLLAINRNTKVETQYDAYSA
jgi:hypothetical protein